MPQENDVPGVLVFPPLIPLAVLIGVLLDWLLPLSIPAKIPLPARVVVGLAFFLSGWRAQLRGSHSVPLYGWKF